MSNIIKRMALSVIAVAAGLLVTVSVIAHHAFSGEFDARKPVLLRGKVVKMQWINPHAWLHLEVENENGEKVVWMVEAGPPGALVRNRFGLFIKPYTAAGYKEPVTVIHSPKRTS